MPALPLENALMAVTHTHTHIDVYQAAHTHTHTHTVAHIVLYTGPKSKYF